MKRQTMNVKTLCFIAGLFTFILQFGVFYFLDSFIIAVLISCIAPIIISHIFLEATIGYTACFLYQCTAAPLALAASVLIYVFPQSAFIQNILLLKGSLFEQHYFFIWVIEFNLILPLIYCILRNLFDHGPRFEYFKKYYIRISIIYCIFHVLSAILLLFFHPNVLFTDTKSSIIMVPVQETIRIVGDTIKNHTYGTACYGLFTYCAIIVPIGFYLSLILQKMPLIIRFLLFLIIPAIGEAIRILAIGYPFHIDRMLWVYLFLIAGYSLAHLLRYCHQKVKGEDFLYEPSPFVSFLSKF